MSNYEEKRAARAARSQAPLDVLLADVAALGEYVVLEQVETVRSVRVIPQADLVALLKAPSPSVYDTTIGLSEAVAHALYATDSYEWFEKHHDVIDAKLDVRAAVDDEADYVDRW